MEVGKEMGRRVDGVGSTTVEALFMESAEDTTTGGTSPCSLVSVLNCDGGLEPISEDAKSLSLMEVKSDMVSRESRFSTTS